MIFVFFFNVFRGQEQHIAATTRYTIAIGITDEWGWTKIYFCNHFHRKNNPKQKYLVIDPSTISGPLYATARATGRKNLPQVSKLADASLMQEVYRTLK